MSVSLATAPAEITSLDRLTTANPTAADLRYRAEFWRAYAMRERASLTVDQYCRILDNCDEMMSYASEPAATVVSLATVRKARTATVKTTTVPKMPTADEFWSMHSAAVQLMVNRHGLNWKVIGHADTVEVRLPAKLCSMTGPLSGKIRWNRDQRIPSPRFWPNGQLPTGIEVNDPGKPREEWATNGIEERTGAAIAEQIVNDRICRGRDAVVSHWKAQHRTSLKSKYIGKACSTVWMRLDLAANCRRAMAAELVAWRDHAERIETEARELATSDLEL